MIKISSLFALPIVLAACVVTAPPPSSSSPPPPAQQPGTTDPTPPAAPAQKAGDGQACSVASDCASGTCEGQGCGPDMGVCVSAKRMCTMDLVPYCGCDGQTFRASSGCPMRLYEHKGECKTGTPAAQPLPAGAACDGNTDCESGICEGQGCGVKQGVCVARNRRCTRDLRPYCGCDGKTFKASGTCPNRRYSKRGPCEEPAAKKPAGASCDIASDCDSGVCEGQGCGPGQGICASKRRICTRDLRPYCGCDGQTFRASGSCPNRRFKARGPCQ